MSNNPVNRLKIVLAEKNMSSADLAEKLGVQAQTVRRYVRRENDPKIALARRMAEILKVPVEEIMGGKRLEQIKKMPVYGAAQGGLGFDITDVSEPIDMIETPPQLQTTADAYAVYVTGESMSPRYMAGERLLVHPGRPPLPGDFVVVQFNDHETRHAAVKRFVETTEAELICEQMNPAKKITYPLKSILAIHKVVGVFY